MLWINFWANNLYLEWIMVAALLRPLHKVMNMLMVTVVEKHGYLGYQGCSQA